MKKIVNSFICISLLVSNQICLCAEIFQDNLAEKLGKDLKIEKQVPKNIVDDLHNGINSIQACIKEHEGASIPLLNSTTRIIMPIIKNEQLYGIAVIFTPRKEIGEIERELLVGISMVVSSSLSQANLFHQISQKKFINLICLMVYILELV